MYPRQANDIQFNSQSLCKTYKTFLHNFFLGFPPFYSEVLGEVQAVFRAHGRWAALCLF